MSGTYEVAEEVEELNEIAKHLRLFFASLCGLHGYIIPSEPSRLVNMLERGMNGRSC